jgi:predicted aspartyl protease
MNILIQSSYETAVNNIRNMILPKKLIFINGFINNIPVKVLIDTGATCSIIFKNTINKLNINYLIDNEEHNNLNGIGHEISVGKIWYINIKLNNINYPVSLVVSNNQINDFDIIIGINFLETYNTNINFITKTIIIDNNIINLHPYNT